jgi:hypothetical protein
MFGSNGLLLNGLLAFGLALLFNMVATIFAWSAMHGSSEAKIVLGALAPFYALEIATGFVVPGGLLGAFLANVLYCLCLVYSMRFIWTLITKPHGKAMG